MKKTSVKPRKYACFTKEQQDAYEKLAPRQRLYVDYRGQGNSKTNSYKMAGFDGKMASQAAYILERRVAGMTELIECLLGQSKARQLAIADSDLNKQIDALAQQDGAEKAIAVIEGADGETAKRIQFYRDIIAGKIKTTRKTTKYNATGALVERKVEEVSDVEAKMKARKELDRILGLNQIPNLDDMLTVGDITINIVDASKREEVEDSRNAIELNPEDVEIIDGEQTIVTEESEEK